MTFSENLSLQVDADLSTISHRQQWSSIANAAERLFRRQGPSVKADYEHSWNGEL